ncbi:serine/threonine-protein kinase atm [Quercus suber]|uniref:Serine/threonine-protein kinase atm n=1 Tax=Quercus suber TaxID=58331 RepID=A0AAW0ITN3_QUESU
MDNSSPSSPMVSIVSHILSLASCASDPAVPLFSRDTIVHAVQTVVDGFLEMENNPITAGVVDKINFTQIEFSCVQFIVEMHYKIAAAVHNRHKCHQLAGIEVSIVSHILSLASCASDPAVPLFSRDTIVHAVQTVVDGFLEMENNPITAGVVDKINFTQIEFSCNPSMEMISVLGEQLQFLVSKLGACCIPSEANGKNSGTGLSQVLSLLLLLTVDSNPAFYDYIRVGLLEADYFICN